MLNKIASVISGGNGQHGAAGSSVSSSSGSSLPTTANSITFTPVTAVKPSSYVEKRQFAVVLKHRFEDVNAQVEHGLLHVKRTCNFAETILKVLEHSADARKLTATLTAQWAEQPLQDAMTHFVTAGAMMGEVLLHTYTAHEKFRESATRDAVTPLYLWYKSAQARRREIVKDHARMVSVWQGVEESLAKERRECAKAYSELRLAGDAKDREEVNETSSKDLYPKLVKRWKAQKETCVKKFQAFEQAYHKAQTLQKSNDAVSLPAMLAELEQLEKERLQHTTEYLTKFQDLYKTWAAEIKSSSDLINKVVPGLNADKSVTTMLDKFCGLFGPPPPMVLVRYDLPCTAAAVNADTLPLDSAPTLAYLSGGAPPSSGSGGAGGSGQYPSAATLRAQQAASPLPTRDGAPSPMPTPSARTPAPLPTPVVRPLPQVANMNTPIQQTPSVTGLIQQTPSVTGLAQQAPTPPTTSTGPPPPPTSTATTPPATYSRPPPPPPAMPVPAHLATAATAAAVAAAASAPPKSMSPPPPSSSLTVVSATTPEGRHIPPPPPPSALAPAPIAAPAAMPATPVSPTAASTPAAPAAAPAAAVVARPIIGLIGARGRAPPPSLPQKRKPKVGGAPGELEDFPGPDPNDLPAPPLPPPVQISSSAFHRASVTRRSMLVRQSVSGGGPAAVGVRQSVSSLSKPAASTRTSVADKMTPPPPPPLPSGYAATAPATTPPVVPAAPRQQRLSIFGVSLDPALLPVLTPATEASSPTSDEDSATPPPPAAAAATPSDTPSDASSPPQVTRNYRAPPPRPDAPVGQVVNVTAHSSTGRRSTVSGPPPRVGQATTMEMCVEDDPTMVMCVEDDPTMGGTGSAELATVGEATGEAEAEAAGDGEPIEGETEARPAVALYDFNLQHEDTEEIHYLAFCAGDIVQVIHTDDDWWFGECNGDQGFFAANYVSLADANDTQ